VDGTNGTNHNGTDKALGRRVGFSPKLTQIRATRRDMRLTLTWLDQHLPENESVRRFADALDEALHKR
jgi:hypothetical protein